MVERVTLLYNGGSVTVAKYSRIKVYHQSLGSIKGFIVGFDDEKITLIVPDDFDLFNNGIIEGKKTSFRNEELKGFAFYPEVKILESKKKSGGGLH